MKEKSIIFFLFLSFQNKLTGGSSGLQFYFTNKNKLNLFQKKTERGNQLDVRLTGF